MKKWDIVILRYPFTDLSSVKARPALVISPDSQGGDDAVFIAITGNTACKGAYDIFVPASDPDYPASGLLVDSVIKVDKIFTLHKSLSAKTIGKAGVSLQAKVKEELARLFELT